MNPKAHRLLHFGRCIGAGPDAGLHARAFEVEAQAPIDDLHVDVHVAIILGSRPRIPGFEVLFQLQLAKQYGTHLPGWCEDLIKTRKVYLSTHPEMALLDSFY